MKLADWRPCGTAANPYKPNQTPTKALASLLTPTPRLTPRLAQDTTCSSVLVAEAFFQLSSSCPCNVWAADKWNLIQTPYVPRFAVQPCRVSVVFFHSFKIIDVEHATLAPRSSGPSKAQKVVIRVSRATVILHTTCTSFWSFAVSRGTTYMVSRRGTSDQLWHVGTSCPFFIVFLVFSSMETDPKGTTFNTWGLFYLVFPQKSPEASPSLFAGLCSSQTLGTIVCTPGAPDVVHLSFSKIFFHPESYILSIYMYRLANVCLRFLEYLEPRNLKKIPSHCGPPLY